MELREIWNIAQCMAELNKSDFYPTYDRRTNKIEMCELSKYDLSEGVEIAAEILYIPHKTEITQDGKRWKLTIQLED